jgi:hypothetical protein
MYYEYRKYEAMPGRSAELNRRFADRTLRYWRKYDITPVAFWEPLFGTSGELHYMLAWESLDERVTKMRTFSADEQWRQEFAETEARGTLVAKYSNQIWIPTDYSPMR